MIKVRIDGIKPISFNRAWKPSRRYGRTYLRKSQEYQQYEIDMLKVLPRKSMVTGWVDVKLTFGLPLRFTNTDVANFEKATTDILEKAEYFENDNRIIRNFQEKVQSDDWFIEIEVIPNDSVDIGN